MADGSIGLMPSLGGVLASVGHPELGPLWYPIALLVESVPCAWLGGYLHERQMSLAENGDDRSV